MTMTVTDSAAWSASTSGYYAGRDRAGQVRRVHLIPPAGTFPRRGIPETATCGQPWWDATNAPRETVPLNQPLPAALTWCPKCLGVAADVLGLTAEVAALLAPAMQAPR